ncbi:MAG: DUF302 domain-containing protein [Candidatus Bathyarchaeota archaeon]|nr:DUF302 domain-containing protein [Candidatus Bathyarchaeota archaeon]
MGERSRFIKKKSAFSVQETMDKLETTLSDRSIAVFAKIDHLKNALDVGMRMNEAQVIYFGNPAIGTILMQENVFLALELPLRIAVVEDDVSDVWVVYNKMSELRARYALQDSDIFTKVDNLLDAVTDLATK